MSTLTQTEVKKFSQKLLEKKSEKNKNQKTDILSVFSSGINFYNSGCDFVDKCVKFGNSLNSNVVLLAKKALSNKG